MENTNSTSAIAKLSIRTEKKLGGKGTEFAAVAATEMAECVCCGKKIRRLCIMTNGDVLGSECAYWFQDNGYRMGRPATKKQIAYAIRRNLTPKPEPSPRYVHADGSPCDIEQESTLTADGRSACSAPDGRTRVNAA